MMYCYYPTTTVAIDDDVNFLKSTTLHLGIADCIAYSSPNKAIAFLQDQSGINSRIQEKAISSKNVNLLTENISFVVDIHKLHEEVYSNARFNDVSVIIVDYYMDEMNGIEVCESLRDHPAKKILLTGGLDKEKIAIEAFNKGIIHRFINKSDANFASQLTQSVAALKEAYFRNITSILLPTFPKNSILLAPAYTNLIKNLQDQFNTVEYYLLDMNGSTIFFDANGLPRWLIVKPEFELQNYKKIAEDQDANSGFIQMLSKGEKIPFFFVDDDYQHPVSDWNRFLYDAHPLHGIRNHYYTIVEGHIRKNLNKEKIIPYTPKSSILRY